MQLITIQAVHVSLVDSATRYDVFLQKIIYVIYAIHLRSYYAYTSTPIYTNHLEYGSFFICWNLIPH